MLTSMLAAFLSATIDTQKLRANVHNSQETASKLLEVLKKEETQWRCGWTMLTGFPNIPGAASIGCSRNYPELLSVEVAVFTKEQDAEEYWASHYEVTKKDGESQPTTIKGLGDDALLYEKWDKQQERNGAYVREGRVILSMDMTKASITEVKRFAQEFVVIVADV